MRWRAWTRALALLLLWSPAVSGQGRDPAAAETVFREGRKAADAGDWTTACPRFAESQRLDPGAGTLINLADCEEHLGKWADAWQHWREAADALGPKDDRLPRVRQRIAAAEKRVPHLTIKLAPSAAPNLTILRDDVLLGTASIGLALPINPGKHVVVVQAPGRADRRYEVRAAEGERQELVVEAGPAAATGPVPGRANPAGPPVLRPQEPKKAGGFSTMGWVVGGLGVAGLALGGVTGLMAMGKKSMDEHCGADGCDPQGMDAASSGKTLSTVSTVGFIAGAVGVGVGAWLILASPTSSTRTAVGAAPVPGGASLVWVGSY